MYTSSSGLYTLTLTLHRSSVWGAPHCLRNVGLDVDKTHQTLVGELPQSFVLATDLAQKGSGMQSRPQTIDLSWIFHSK